MTTTFLPVGRTGVKQALGLVGCLLAALTLTSCSSSSTSEGSPDSPPTASVAPSTQTPAQTPAPNSHLLLRESIRTMLTGLTPAQVTLLCDGMKADPNGTAESFARPLSATGVDPVEAGAALVEELNVVCHLSLKPIAPASS